MPEDQTPTRLDSWKAIAHYLKRDVRTVRRWEQSMGLPVRRLPGHRGHSVFAYVSEIEAWLQKAASAGNGTPEDGTSEAPDVTSEPELARRDWPRWTFAALVVVGLGFIAWRIGLPHASASELQIQVTPAQVIAATPNGAELWHYSFPADEETAVAEGSTPLMAHGQGVYVLVGGRIGVADRIERGGELLQIAEGRLERTFRLTDHVGYPHSTFGPPWGLTALRVNGYDSGKTLAVTAHVRTWWTSLVTLLDERFQRRGTFVNAGWILGVEWAAADRLIVSGISNAEDAGFVALLDANAINGQSPVTKREFECDTCGHESSVLRYVVFPRSELNRVTGSKFNEAHLEWRGTDVKISTIEVETKVRNFVDAVYELSPALDVTSASYSDRYWDLHRALEAEGKLKHDRANCPDRDGPPAVRVWDPVDGWKAVSLRPAKAERE